MENSKAMMEIIMKYWGLDWIIFLLVICNLWLLSSKYLKTAYFLGASAAFLGIIFSYWAESFGGIVANVTYVFLHTRNIYRLGSLKLPVESSPSSSADIPRTCLSPSASCLPQDVDCQGSSHSHNTDKLDHTP